MAACGHGVASNIKLLELHPGPKKFRCTKNFIPFRESGNQQGYKGMRAAQLERQRGYSNSLIVCCGLSSETVKDGEENISEEKQKRKEQNVPSSSEVRSLLATICDTTSVVEFKLDLAEFGLYVRRNMDSTAASYPIPVLPVAESTMPTQSPTENGSATTTSLAIIKSKPSSGVQNFVDTAPDEGLIVLQSPKVGFFRRSRTIKGKRTPPFCKEKQVVKEGQVLCFIEQLGGEIPIESDVSGEVIKILRDDGEPVGYGDALIAILPSFPGIKKLH